MRIDWMPPMGVSIVPQWLVNPVTPAEPAGSAGTVGVTTAKSYKDICRIVKHQERATISSIAAELGATYNAVAWHIMSMSTIHGLLRKNRIKSKYYYSLTPKGVLYVNNF